MHKHIPFGDGVGWQGSGHRKPFDGELDTRTAGDRLDEDATHRADAVVNDLTLRARALADAPHVSLHLHGGRFVTANNHVAQRQNARNISAQQKSSVRGASARVYEARIARMAGICTCVGDVEARSEGQQGRSAGDDPFV